jgi:hypothetical protein
MPAKAFKGNMRGFRIDSPAIFTAKFLIFLPNLQAHPK